MGYAYTDSAYDEEYRISGMNEGAHAYPQCPHEYQGHYVRGTSIYNALTRSSSILKNLPYSHVTIGRWEGGEYL